MSTSILSAADVRRALSIRDLTHPAEGEHAMQLLVAAAAGALAAHWRIPVYERRASPIVSVADNYDRLRYPADAVARDARYTRYVCDVAVLRTQTSALMAPILASAPDDDALLVGPGIVYRRDCIDRLHTGEPHQLDLWRIGNSSRAKLGVEDLRQMIAVVVEAIVPGREWRVSAAEHPYTTDGLQIDVRDRQRWIEIGECGLVHPALARAGLAMGIGLDRVLMLRKGITDIRLLRSSDPRISTQMLDLSPYRPVSALPAIRRDLSIVVARETTPEELGDRVRSALGTRGEAIEEVKVVSETAHDDLPPAARTRLALGPDQKNVLVRVVLRDLSRTLTHAEANELRNGIYAAIHEGTVQEWA